MSGGNEQSNSIAKKILQNWYSLSMHEEEWAAVDQLGRVTSGNSDEGREKLRCFEEEVFFDW